MQMVPEAVRGVYIAPTFPGGGQNVSGWADWSGSSFATAIISGLGAHLIARIGHLPMPSHVLQLAKSAVPKSCLAQVPMFQN